MAKRRGGQFKKMMGLGFISFEKAFSDILRSKMSAEVCYESVHLLPPRK
jgi:hypothetical protein